MLSGVLNGELYAQRLQKLIYLHLSFALDKIFNADKLTSVISVNHNCSVENVLIFQLVYYNVLIIIVLTVY